VSQSSPPAVLATPLNAVQCLPSSDLGQFDKPQFIVDLPRPVCASEPSVLVESGKPFSTTPSILVPACSRWSPQLNTLKTERSTSYRTGTVDVRYNHNYVCCEWRNGPYEGMRWRSRAGSRGRNGLSSELDHQRMPVDAAAGQISWMERTRGISIRSALNHMATRRRRRSTGSLC